MAGGDPQQFDAVSQRVFAMDPEPTLRQLARCLVVSQKEMADLERDAQIVRACGAVNVQTQNLLTECDEIQRQWVTQRLPCLAAAMRLALEVYDTFGPGMVRLDDPIEAEIWNNKYFVWERDLSLTPTESRDVHDR